MKKRVAAILTACALAGNSIMTAAAELPAAKSMEVSGQAEETVAAESIDSTELVLEEEETETDSPEKEEFQEETESTELFWATEEVGTEEIITATEEAEPEEVVAATEEVESEEVAAEPEEMEPEEVAAATEKEEPEEVIAATEEVEPEASVETKEPEGASRTEEIEETGEERGDLEEDRSFKQANNGTAVTVSNAAEFLNAVKEAKQKATRENPYTITLAAGTYPLDTRLVISGNITLDLSKATIAYSNADQRKYAFYIGNASAREENITVIGGTFQGGGIQLYNASNVSVSGCSIKNPVENGIYIQGNCSLAQLKEITVSGGEGGIYMNQSSVAGDIANCRISDVSGCGIRINNSNAAGIKDNHISGGSKANGIYVQGGSALSGGIEKNSVSGCEISIYLNAATAGNIADNTVSGGVDSIYINGKSHVGTIKGNTVSGKKCGIFLGDSEAGSIENCTITAAEEYGIRLNGSKASAIKNNVILGGGTEGANGIYVQDSSKAAGGITNNEISGCGEGIYVTKSSLGAVTGNSIKDSKKYGMYFFTGTAINGNIEGNRIDSVGDTSKNKAYNEKTCGIQLYTANLKGEIKGNTVQNARGIGILVTGPTEKKAGSVVTGNIDGNTVTNCLGDGIGVYHASHCGEIINNQLDTIGGNHNGNEGDYGIIVDSMMKADTYSGRIAYNTVKNVTYAAIAIYSGPSASTSTIYQDTAHVKGNIEYNTVINSGTYTPPGNKWENVVKKGCLSGIYVDTHARVYGDICHNTVEKIGEHGIYIHLLSYVENIYNNHVSETKEAGIEIFNSTVFGNVYNNTIKNAGTNGIAGGDKGIVKGKVHNNTIQNAGECGIYLEESNFATISNNKITGAKKHGIYTRNKSRANNILSNKISFNNAKDGYGIGISEDCITKKIQKNTISGKGTYGIRVMCAKNNIEISSNTITTNNAAKQQYSPIYLKGNKSYTFTVKNNKVTGNKSNYGIRILEGKSTVTGNTVKKCTYPIYIVSNKYNSTVKGNTLSGNQSNTVKTQTKKVDTAAVKISSVKKLRGNKVKVTWKRSKTVQNYVLYQAASKKGSFKKVKDVKAGSYQISGLKKGKMYYFKVQGYQKDGKITVYTDAGKEPNGVKSIKL